MNTPDSGVPAVLLRLQQLAEQFGRLDERESEHYRDVSAAMTGLGGDLDKRRGTGVSHGKVLVDLDAKLTELSDAVKSLLPPEPGPLYHPGPAVRWWDPDLPAGDREKAMARLRGWVEVIFRGQYGHLGAKLGSCWEQHPLCLIELDWASELWRVLYKRATRSAGIVNSQAEYGTRILPALADQRPAETNGCAPQRPQVPREWNTR